MRLRVLWLSSAAILALLATYYAGYRQGVQKRFVAQNPAIARAGESDRLREPAPRTAPLNSISQDDYDALLARDLAPPISGLKRSEILDTFDQGRAGGKRHEATDIMAPRGTPIHAVEDGTIRKLFLSKAGGNTIYEFDPQAVYCFYYAHLDRYAEGLQEGMKMRKGDVIGYVGSTGDAVRTAPHLHFAIVRLGTDKKWWEGTAINPYPILLRLASE
jgi:murein DD-endopeptidase MepM/ murein hydrolase activator NlpD